MVERWRSIPGNPGYEASDQGRIRSVDREVNGRKYRGQVLKPAPYTKQGHLSLPLGRSTNGIPVHELVLRAFVGPRPPDADVLHGNGTANDNWLTNLRYGTRTENNLETTLHGRRKLTPKRARELRRFHAEGWSYLALSEEFGICRSHVWNIVSRKQYAHV